MFLLKNIFHGSTQWLSALTVSPFSALDVDLDNQANIPWIDTVQSNKARNVLQEIVNHSCHPIKTYLIENAIVNLSPPTGNTPITYSSISAEAICKNVDTFPLHNTFLPSQFSPNSGVYLVHNTVNGENSIGSAFHFRSRWENHYADMFKRPSKLHSAMQEYGVSNFTWTPIYNNTNHVLAFLSNYKDYNLTYSDYRALQIFVACRSNMKYDY